MFFEDEVFVDFFFVLCGWNFFHDLGIFWDFFLYGIGGNFWNTFFVFVVGFWSFLCGLF